MTPKNTTRADLTTFDTMELYSYAKPATENNGASNIFSTLFMECLSMAKTILATVRKNSPILYWIAMSMFLLSIGCLIGLLVDERMLMGVNVWIKPLKFSISIGIFLLTTGYLITKYPYSKRKTNLINNILSWSFLLEMGIIAFQASRGVPSHYNEETPLDAILFLFMGVFVGISVLIMALFILDTVRLKLKTTKAIQWAVFLGWLVVLFGSWVGGQMISQVAHTVGVADGGAGLPMVNWSTVGGDLRVAHFFALHGIQVIPLFALVLSRKWKTQPRNQVIAVTIFGMLYATWIGFIFYQAKQGIPFIVI